MNRTIFPLLFFLSGVIGVYAQDTLLLPESPVDEEPSVVVVNREDDALFIPESWDMELDSLMKAWHIQYYVDQNAHPGYNDPVTASDAVYAERLSKLNNIIELSYNEVVRRSIEMYVDRRRTMLEYMLGLENIYFPIFEAALDAHQLPLELKYLPIIESALNPTALSRAGASGLWQFMIATGKQYGLEINSLVDERRDPLKSTQAACAYLKTLFGIYGDWNLALAAYNCGPGNVNKAIRRSGGKTDYWEIYPYLPKETRMYLPFFIAANYAMNYYAHHQLRPVQTLPLMATDTVMTNQAIHFDQIAEVLNIEKELLRTLNPQYKRDIVPGNSQPRSIRLPVLQTYAFIEKEDIIANHRKDELFSNRITNNQNTQEKIIHKVRAGETMQSISHKYGVNSANIRKWNGLKSNSIAVGRNLTIYADNGGYILAESTAQTVQKTQTTQTVRSNSTAVPQASNKHSAEYGSYRVKSGDSYSSIAKRYPGYTSSDLMRMNNAKDSRLMVGQYIKVPKI